MVEIAPRRMLEGVAMGGLLWNTAALSSESRQAPYGPRTLDGPQASLCSRELPATTIGADGMLWASL